MSVYLKAALIVTSLVAAATVSAQPVLTASAANCTADTHSLPHGEKKPQRSSHTPSNPDG